VSLTRYALEKFGDYYQRRFRMPLRVWHGHLAWENKAIFQREYTINNKLKGMPSEEAAISAVRATPFGTHRIAIGFTKFTVTMGDDVDIEFGGALGDHRVPNFIAVLAEKP
jgi:hypothetical protein